MVELRVGESVAFITQGLEKGGRELGEGGAKHSIYEERKSRMTLFFHS